MTAGPRHARELPVDVLAEQLHPLDQLVDTLGDWSVWPILKDDVSS